MTNPEFSETGYAGPVQEHMEVVVYNQQAAELGNLALVADQVNAVATANEYSGNELAVSEGVVQRSEPNPDINAVDSSATDMPPFELPPAPVPHSPTPEDPFFSKEQTERASPLWLKALRIQQKMQQYKEYEISQSGKTGFDYTRRLAEESHKFVDLLTNNQIQREQGKFPFPLTEAGYDLITRGLDRNEVPDAKTLVGLKRIVESQGLSTVLPHEKNPDGSIGQYFPDAAQQKPRYLTRRKDVRIGPFDSPEQDSVADTIRKLDPEYWFLPDDKRDFLKRVIATDKLVKQTKPYRSGPHRFPSNPDDTDMRLAVRAPYEALKKRSYDKNNPQEDPNEVNNSLEIMAWFQNRTAAEVAADRRVKPDLILKAAKLRAQPLLDRDTELRFLKSELNDNDSKTEPRIDMFIGLSEANKKNVAESELIKSNIDRSEYEMELAQGRMRLIQEKSDLYQQVIDGLSTMTTAEIDNYIEEQSEAHAKRASDDYKAKRKAR